jgi:hypothetical protein
MRIVNREVYTKGDYKNLLLKLERFLIVKALTRTKGRLKDAHALLCPKNIPYSYNHLGRVMKKHSLNRKDYV